MTDDSAPFVVFVEDPPITIGTVTGSRMLEGLVVTEFGRCVLEYVENKESVHLLLNFENVTYLASAALSELILISDAVVASGGSLRLCGLTERIQQVFEIANFTKVLEVHSGENVEHAVTRFKRSIDLAKEEDAWDDRS